jgi:hypothetical protein
MESIRSGAPHPAINTPGTTVAGNGEMMGESDCSDTFSPREKTGESARQSASDPKKEAPSSSADDYHLSPPYRVYQDGSSGRWIMDLPGGKIQCPGKPQWLATMDKINGILDRSEKPRELRSLMDLIKSTADSTYDSGSHGFKNGGVHRCIVKIDDSSLLRDLTEIFQLRLDDETQSTNRIGGSMAGALCSEMAKYGEIMRELGARIG